MPQIDHSVQPRSMRRTGKVLRGVVCPLISEVLQPAAEHECEESLAQAARCIGHVHMLDLGRRAREMGTLREQRRMSISFPLDQRPIPLCCHRVAPGEPTACASTSGAPPATREGPYLAHVAEQQVLAKGCPRDGPLDNNIVRLVRDASLHSTL